MFFRPCIVLAIAALLVPSANAQEIDFNRDVRPLLNMHCVACHGGVKQAGDISFVYQDQAMLTVASGSPDDSTLFQRVTAEDDEERMPPAEHGRRLNDSEISILRRWIEQGAPWSDHWAFVPPQKSELSTRGQNQWSRQRIDGFVSDKLQQMNLQPSAESTPDQWLRRVSIDLVGLPPTPQQRDQFHFELSVDRERAYAAVVDRLLGSPSYGERWASVWLDAVRYADSRGLGQDGRRDVWKYRDWVIKAFNADMPYNEFTVRQIAGDLLPNPTLDDLVATTCHRLTQSNEEGGTDDEQFRIEAIIDRVNTTWQTWQGLTMGCVQCHSHPYDPIRHEEYYQSFAFFNNTLDCDLNSEFPNVVVPINDANNAKVAHWSGILNAVKKEDWQSSAPLIQRPELWQPLSGIGLQSNNTTQVQVVQVDGVEEFKTVGNVARDTTITIRSNLPADCKQLTALQFTGLPEDETKALMFSEGGFVISHFQANLHVKDQAPIPLDFVYVVNDEFISVFDPQESLNPKSPNGFGAFSKIFYPRSAAFVLAKPLDVPAGAELEVSISQKLFDLDAFPLVAHRGRVAFSSDPIFTDWWQSPDRADRHAKIAECKKELAAIPSVQTPIMQERDSPFERISTVFERGDFLSKGERVHAATPQFLHPLETPSTPSRLDFARWLASDKNPLTARVAVNRIWAQLFGRGLVETQEDFGSSGDPPSHPELLDDLAVRFTQEMHWSIKQLLREIVLSATYRQSSHASPEMIARDPANQWLARGPRVRLPAETVRDQALAISGLLSDRMYGTPTFPSLPEGVWTPFQSWDHWTTPQRGNPERYRRTVYTYTKRSIPFPIMASFDAPTREFCSSRRLQSNTPIQALMTLNDEAFVEAIEPLADRMLASSSDLNARIEFGFTLATCRTPTPAEQQALGELYQKALAENSANQPADHASQPSSPPSETIADKPLGTSPANDDKLHQRKAMQSVAAVLLNLDEIFTN